jgi:hypothetical protein
MKFLEKDLEEIIFESNRDKLADKGLYIEGKLLRQLRIGNYGVADLVSFQRPFYHTGFNSIVKGTITVFELKQDSISVSAFFQAVRYIRGIQRWMSEYSKIDDCFDYQIVLIGKTHAPDVVYLPNLFDVEIGENEILSEMKTKVKLYSYHYDIDGISFNDLYEYRLSDESFKRHKPKLPF